MTPKTSPFAVFGFVLAGLVFVADQASKYAVLYGLGLFDCLAAHTPSPSPRLCDPIVVTSFFDLIMVWNRGISYGLLPADSPGEVWLLIGFSLVMSAILAWWMLRAETRLLAAGLAIVIGGALGNVIDRLLYGAVADFFHFHAFGYSWYVFNVADAGIVLGVGVILIDALFGGRASPSPQKDASTHEP